MLFLCIPLFVLSLGSHVQAQFENTRCRCVCPSVNSLTAAAGGTNVTKTANDEKRKFYTANVEPAQCTCPNVVLTKAAVPVEKGNEFCLRCQCKFSSRNATVIKVTVIIILCALSVLVIYMIFLLCMDPVLKRRRQASKYQQHTDEDDENIFGEGSSRVAGMDMEGESSRGRTTSARAVVNRLQREQGRWIEQVQQQRDAVFKDHGMLS